MYAEVGQILFNNGKKSSTAIILAFHSRFESIK